MPDIKAVRNMNSGIIEQVERLNRTSQAERLPIGVMTTGEEDSFANIFNKALENISATNGYISDAENEQIRWALGETDNTHDLAIALQKASTALQYTIAIRDRVIAAYREITQMQI